MHANIGDEDCFHYDERDSTSIKDIRNKAIAEYEAKHSCKVNCKPDSPYVRLQDRSRYPRQGSIVSEAKTAGGLLELFKKKYPSILVRGFMSALAHYLGLWGPTSTISRVPLHFEVVKVADV